MSDADLAAVRDFAGPGVPVHLGARRTARSRSPDTTLDLTDRDLQDRRTSGRATGRGDVGAVIGTSTSTHAAVDRLRASYDAIPPGAPVRLAKQTSNLFRPRSADDGPGLDVCGLAGVIAVDPDGATADVQGMCTYEDLVDATLPHGLIPFVVPQLRTITLGGAVTGLGIESTSFRNGLPHESVLEMDVFTGAGEVVTATPDDEHADLFARSPTPTARSATPPGCGSSWSRCLPTSRCGTCASTTSTRSPDAIAEITETREWRRRARRRHRRRRVRAGRGLPDAGALDRREPRPDQRLHRAGRSTSARSSSARPTC